MITIKLMTTAAFALATIAMPALAQTTTGAGGMALPTTDSQNGSMSDGSMSDGTMSEGSMSTGGRHRMTKAQTATMKRCQKMTRAKMAKNKSCMNVQRMQGDMSHTM